MNKVRAFLTFAVLALLLYGINAGPASAAHLDPETGKRLAVDGALDDVDCPCITPTVEAGSYSGDEGSAIPLDKATATAPNGNPLTYSWSVNTELCTFDDPSLLHPTLTCEDDGVFTATLTVDDGTLCSPVGADALVTVENVAPTCSETSPITVGAKVGQLITFTAAFTDPGVWDTHTAAWDWDDGNTATGTVLEEKPSDSGSVTNEHSYSITGTYTITLVVTDNFPEDSNACTYTVEVPPCPIKVDAGAYSGYEGSPILLSDATASDPDGAALTYSWIVDSEELCSFDDPSLLHPTLTCKDDGEFTATLSASNGSCIQSADAPVTVENVAPTCGPITAEPARALVNAPITFTAPFTDPGVLDTHTAAWNWGDETSSPGTVTEVKPSDWGSVEDTHSYSVSGTYTVGLTVIDNYPDRSKECTVTVEAVDGCPPSIFVSDRIEPRPAEVPGEVFFSTTLSVPAPVPGCPKCFCLSSQPDTCEEILVDDVLTISMDGTEIFGHNFAPGCQRLIRDIVNIPALTAEQIAGQTITIQYQDGCGGFVRSDEMWLVPTPCACQPPTVEAGSYSGDEGSAIPLDKATATAPNGNPLTYSWSVDNEELCTFDDPSLLQPTLTCKDDGEFTATLTVDDGTPCSPVSEDAPVTFYNVAPICYPTSPTWVGADVGELITFTAAFTDPGVLDMHTASWDWGDGGASVPGTVTEQKPSDRGSVTDTHSYGITGTYPVTLTVSDELDLSNECRYLVDVPPCDCPPIPLSGGIPWEPTVRDAVFYTDTVPVPMLPPCCKCWYLSSQPDTLVETLVDDRLAFLLNESEIFCHQFAPRCDQLKPAIVKVPQSTMELIAGQTIALEYRDDCGGSVGAKPVYLVSAPCPDQGFPISVSKTIVWGPVQKKGEIYFTASVNIPDQLPEGGSFYLSSRPDEPAETLIDDELSFFLCEQVIWGHNYAPGCVGLEPAIVEIPRETMEEMAGRTLTIQYQDVCGGSVGAKPVWLIWVP
jgi:PKD repeat protein